MQKSWSTAQGFTLFMYRIDSYSSYDGDEESELELKLASCLWKAQFPKAKHALYAKFSIVPQVFSQEREQIYSLQFSLYHYSPKTLALERSRLHNSHVPCLKQSQKCCCVIIKEFLNEIKLECFFVNSRETAHIQLSF